MKAVFAFCVALIVAAPVEARDVLIIGEVHDNPAHHTVQAERVGALQPKAIVFEMLTADQAAKVTDEIRQAPAVLEHALGWADSGWPDFALYYPVFSAAPDARVYGAGLSRGKAHEAINVGIEAVFGPDAQAYGLTDPLLEAEQAARQALQFAAHCEALPREMLAGMVAIQRLRDAMLAREIVMAIEETGGPVAVITGNGHARRDWGVPAVLARVVPELRVRVIGQTEADAPLEGGFDEVVSAPAVDRPDPCAAFQ